VQKVRNALIGLAVTALVLGFAAPAGAQTIRFTEGGQPVASGQVEGEEAHGVIHCPAAAEFFSGAPKGSAPGVVVISPVGTRLGAPKGGTCEEISEVFGG
jgi:hypothetical protein